MRKPHPAILEPTLTTLQIASHQAIYVSDTYVDDYQGATAANIHCLWLDPQQRYPQVPDRIGTVFDLVAYHEQLHQP
jgi:FMN phosphatase YigB (HAD superfamily)